MMYLIIGRTASGKDTLAQHLKNIGVESVVSRTTRPKRSEDEDTHIFVTKDEAAEQTDRLAETVIDGNEYYVLEEDLIGKSIYIVDPKGAREIAEHAPDELFVIAYVAAPEDIRKKRYLSRGATEEDFDKRNSDEDAQFTDFEKNVLGKETLSDTDLPDNIRGVRVFQNADNDPATLQNYAEDIRIAMVENRRMTAMLNQAVWLGRIKTDGVDKILTYNREGDGHIAERPEFVANTLLNPNNMEGFALFMRDMLQNSPTFEEFAKDIQ